MARDTPPLRRALAAQRPGPRPPGPAPTDRSYCPECGHDLTLVYDPPKATGEFAVCPRCAAIAVMTADGYFRLCYTDEWWNLMVSPKYHDLMAARIAVLERLTAPAR